MFPFFEFLQNSSAKGGTMSEDTGNQKIWISCGGKFEFSAQDRDFEYIFGRNKNLSVSSDIIPPLIKDWR